MMKFASNGWVRVFAWVVSISVVWATITPLGFSLSVFVWASALGFLALVTRAVGEGSPAPRSIDDLVGAIAAEPILAVATSPAVESGTKRAAR
jgi:hypothetical protein